MPRPSGGGRRQKPRLHCLPWPERPERRPECDLARLTWSLGMVRRGAEPTAPMAGRMENNGPGNRGTVAGVDMAR